MDKILKSFTKKSCLLISSLLFLVFLILLQVFQRVLSENMDNTTLVFVQIFFRHGNRTPVREGSFKGDQYINRSYHPYGQGDLTQKGRQRCYQLGKSLYKRYKHFIDEEYYYDMVESHTSDFRRTKMSLQIVLAAMFPPKGIMVVEEELNWQPIPYDYVPFLRDNYIAKFMRCSRLFVNSYRNIDNETEFVINHIEKHLGWRPTRPLDVNLIYDTLKVQEDIELELPQWATQIYPEKLTNEYLKYMTGILSDKEIVKEANGEQIQRMIDYMLGKMNGKVKSKFVLYSGHDYNIYLLLSTLGNYQKHLVPCLGHIIMELHKIHENYYVKVFYDDFADPNKEPLQLTLPGCEINCPVEEFSQILQEYCM